MNLSSLIRISNSLIGSEACMGRKQVADVRLCGHRFLLFYVDGGLTLDAQDDRAFARFLSNNKIDGGNLCRN